MNTGDVEVIPIRYSVFNSAIKPDSIKHLFYVDGTSELIIFYLDE